MMKSRRHVLNQGIVLVFVFGLSGFVSAAPTDDGEKMGMIPPPGEVEERKGKVQPSTTVAPTEPPVTEDIEKLKRKEWEVMVEDKEDETDLGKKDRERLGLETDSKVLKMVVIVTWRPRDNKINPKREAMGWYNTLGILIADNLILAVPSKEIKGNSTNDWYVKSVLISLHDSRKRKRIGKKELVAMYPATFSQNLDKAHRIAVIRLLTPIAPDSGMKPAPLVGNPLAVRRPKGDEDYAMTNCDLVLVNNTHLGQRMLKLVPTSLARCVWVRSLEKEPSYRDRVCAYLKMPFVRTELLADRIFYPHDFGSPVFCSGVLAGIYMGIQNVYGAWHRQTPVPHPKDVMQFAYPPKTWDQYVVEAVGNGPDWDFIRGFGDETHQLHWESLMPEPEEEKCEYHDSAPLRPPKTGNKGDGGGGGGGGGGGADKDYDYDLESPKKKKRGGGGKKARGGAKSAGTDVRCVSVWLGVAAVVATLDGRLSA